MFVTIIANQLRGGVLTGGIVSRTGLEIVQAFGQTLMARTLLAAVAGSCMV